MPELASPFLRFWFQNTASLSYPQFGETSPRSLALIIIISPRPLADLSPAYIAQGLILSRGQRKNCTEALVMRLQILQKQHHKKCMACSKENQSWDLRSEGVISKGKSVTTPIKWDTYMLFTQWVVCTEKKKKNKPQTPRLSPFNSQDLLSNSTYCLPYSSCDISFENLVLDQLTTLQMIFFLVSITCLLDRVLISLGEILSWSLMGVKG